MLGETKSKKLNGNNINIDLSSNAIEKVSNLSDKSKNGDNISSAITFMLESLILEDNNKILKLMAYLFVHNSINKDNSNDVLITNYLEYVLSQTIISEMNRLSKKAKIPQEVLIPTYNDLKNEMKI